MKKKSIIMMFVLATILIRGTLNVNAMGNVNIANLELVMSEGEIIKATTQMGELTIVAGKGMKRTYKWDRCKRSVTMWARRERWLGSLGAYYPAPSYLHWVSCNGISRCVVQEGIQHFNSNKELFEWINKRKWMELVYTSDGLLVCWQKSPQREQLSVEVWQLLVNEKKPNKLKGADDLKIQRIKPTLK
jgi:hypothetical protein